MLMNKYRASTKSGKFCKKSCKVRPPNSDSVVHFDTTFQALLNTFYPCNICKPLQITNKTPKFIQEILYLIGKNPYVLMTKKDILIKGIDFDELDRWFRKYHGLGFIDAQRILILNKSFNDIYRNKNIKISSDVKFDFRTVFGDITNSEIFVNIDLIRTPIGPMYACASEESILLLEFSNQKKVLSDLRKIVNDTKAAIRVQKNKHIEALKLQMDEYFSGKRKYFDLNLSNLGTEFQNQVWSFVNKIEYGTLASFQEIADKMNHSKSVRAVASAVGANPLRIIVACHRVVGVDGKLLGYGGGFERKRWLIDHESFHSGKSVQKSINYFF